jgi:Helix-turn-helix domain
MSHFATNWAIQLRGLEAATKVLLWHLADCHNPAQGCFPTQAYLADRCELSRASVNRHLAILVQRNLIARERLFDVARQCQLPTRYYLACEPNFEQHRMRLAALPKRGLKPCRSSGHGAESQNSGKPSLNFSESRVSDCDPNPVTKPVKEPPSGTRARAGSDFSKLWERWPEPERPRERSYVEKLFGRLSPGDRGRAVQFAHQFRTVRACQGGIARMVPYVRERLFREFDGAPEIDHEGYFVIKPEREEWTPWIETLRIRHGEVGAATAQRLGYFRATTRWPEPNAAAHKSCG